MRKSYLSLELRLAFWNDDFYLSLLCAPLSWGWLWFRTSSGLGIRIGPLSLTYISYNSRAYETIA